MKNTVKTALVAALAVAGAAACTSAPAPTAAPTTTVTSTTTEPAPAPSTSVVTEVVTATVTQPVMAKVDPRVGYGALKLGMTLEEAKATGLVTGDPGAEDTICWRSERITYSWKYGVVRINLPLDAKTSRGISAGATVADLKRAYPEATEYRAGFSTNLDQNSVLDFVVLYRGEHAVDTDRVKVVKLISRKLDCSMADL